MTGHLPEPDDRREGIDALFPRSANEPDAPDRGQAGGGAGTPPDRASESRRFGIGVVLAFTVLALVAGGAAGAVGGSFAARDSRQQGPPVTAENALTAAPRTSPAPRLPPPPAHSVQAVAEKLLPVVVQLRYRVSGAELSGSGVVISSDGEIITNNHVIAKAAKTGAEVRAVFHDGTTAGVNIVGRDPTSDIAVVSAEGVSGRPTATLGRSDTLRVGQTVVAIGSPYELSGTVTVGIVSALHRAIRAGGTTGESDTSTVMDAIQTDAAINHGNSGGPLVDTAGRVIGINSAIYSPRGGIGSDTGGGNVGIGFAIPIDTARRIALELAKTGNAVQTVLGVKVTDSGVDHGALLVDVDDGGPAGKGGLRPGDVVVRADDRTVDSADSLIAAVHAAKPGQSMTLTVRGGRTAQVTLGSREVH